MLDAICREIKNYFSQESDRYIGDFEIVNGELTPPISMQEGQYYRIVDSAFNEDVYIRGQEELKDETTFHGAVWLMRPPKAFLELVKDIEEWQAKFGGVNSVNLSPYTSESFGGYSYSKSAGGNGDGQSGVTWQSTFANRLNPYRRLIL